MKLNSIRGARLRFVCVLPAQALACLLLSLLPGLGEESSYQGEGRSSRLGVGFVGQLPDFDLQTPDTKSEVVGEWVGKLGLTWMRDLWAGTADGPDAPPIPPPVLEGLPEAQAAWFYGRLGFAPVGALAGTAYGSLAGVSAAKIERSLPPLVSALNELQLTERFEPLLLGLLQEKVRGVVLLTNPLPQESTFPLPTLMERVAPWTPEANAFRRGRRDISRFEGAEVVVLLRVVNWGLSGRSGRNSPLSTSIIVKGTLVNAKERTQGRSFYAVYESSKHRFTEWSAHGGQRFREELWRAVESVANQIAQQMPPPPPPAAPAILLGGEL